MSDYKIKIDGKEYAISMRMASIKEYKKITGRNLLDPKELGEILGYKDKSFNGELFVAWVQACLIDGGLSKDESEKVAGNIRLTDGDTITNLVKAYIFFNTGASKEQVEELYEKNVSALRADRAI